MTYNHAKSGTITRIEAAQHRPFVQIVSGLAGQGFSQRMAAQHLGVHENTFYKLMHDYFPEVAWPGKNKGLRCIAAHKSVADKIRARRRSESTFVEYKGEVMTLIEAAGKSGIHYKTLWKRYAAGKRGKELFKRPHPTMGKGKRNYRLKITAGEADMIIAYANERGIKAAHCKFGIPFGAVRALRDGEWHRIDA